MGRRARLVARLEDAVHDPVAWNAVVQLGKTAAAAVLAWVLAASLLDLPQPFLAPWAALLVVHATVYRTFSRGLQQVVAAVVGVLLAAAVGQLFGLDTLAIAVLLVSGLVIGSWRWFGAEATTVAATALVVLTTGYTDDTALISRLLDTGIGVGTGLLVNVAVWPPLSRRTAFVVIDQLDDRIGELLQRIGRELEEDGAGDEQVRGWVERSRDLDAELDEAWALVRNARESAWMNARRSAHPFRDPQEWYSLLHRMEQAIAEIRSMARTLGSRPQVDDAASAFYPRWTPLLREAGASVQDADAGRLEQVGTALEGLVGDLSTEEALRGQWPVHGALLTNLRNVLDAMGDVARVNPLGRPPTVMDRLPRR